MDFDLFSMKKRTKAIMNSTTPNVLLISLVLTLLLFIGTVLGIRMLNKYPEKSFVTYIIGVAVLNMAKLGYIGYTINVAREKERKLVWLFQGFYKHPIKNLSVILLKNIILGISFLLLYIPGVVMFYKLRFLYYELVNEDKTIGKAFKDSMKLMKGNSLELFKIDVSFFGWYLLNVITLGFASIYVRPLITITYVEYYDYLKAKERIFNT